MRGYYVAVCGKLTEHGYRLLRQASGSHEIWTNGKRNQPLSRNMPSREMANKIMKQAGINHKF